MAGALCGDGEVRDAAPNSAMKTVLICHDDAPLDREGLARWLGSWSDFTGMVVLSETAQRKRKRIRRELQRVGPVRFMDVLAFRIYYRLFLAASDAEWEDRALRELCEHYSESNRARVLHSHSPNTPEVEDFIRDCAPDVVIARCKTLLKESVFSIPTRGTYVLHPGICPEYRNAHGCFWALVHDDLERVGVTLLRIDRGVDTGPVYGYFGYAYDQVRESHHVIQHRAVLENLPAIQERLMEIHTGHAVPMDTAGRPSATWGQPWLSSHLRWKYRARQRAR